MDKETYQKCLREDIRNRTLAPRCVRCGEDDPVVLEKHHIFTRNASDREELFCKNCHAKITNEQNKVSPRSRSKDASYLEMVAYQLITIGALLRDVGIQLIKVGHELICYAKNSSQSLHSKS